MIRPTVVYLVSRFPVTSETFIVREIEALNSSGRFDVELRSLFSSPDSPVHEIARRWNERLVRPTPAAAAVGFGWALLTRPLALLAVLVAVIGGYHRRPPLAVRALVTVLLACAHARDLARRPGPLHVHAHYATYPALAAWVCRRLIGTDYSFTVHAHDLYVDTSMLDRKISDARYVVTISEYNRVLLERHNAAHTPIHVVHAGIDTAAYRFRPRGVPRQGAVRALTVASLQSYKGHAVLLDALALGGPGVDRIALDLIGDGVLRGDLEDLVDRLGLRERVRFLGSCSEDQVRSALETADLFVLPSIVADDGQMEGLPVALMEALACGVPTVSTDLSGIPEIVVDGVTGLLAKPGDSVGLNRTLAEMVQLGSAAVKFAEAGRLLVTREFDLEKTICELGELLAGSFSGTGHL
ncbi:glycosyltransferase [Mycobacterium sp. CVI_P3]|uniref:Glycosyltransferase n=1 Tax=Mycobacterium pinniadriaticum TaxID=2994102 RepID=A0ABT3SHW2_9MYCO|nr:glycosyltransferase [Mycobacterium pinniadriaticum]MCX2932697.1 glycosyltransferase [Mycobacterium pinniadriaticum]MCX2939121.1 glycosyltransferase [Mycobacterium pinniadriaticum]